MTHSTQEFEEDFRSLGQDLAETDVAEWLTSDDQDPGYEHLDDNVIVYLVLTNQEQTIEVDFDDESEIDDGCHTLSSQSQRCHGDVQQMSYVYSTNLKLQHTIQVSCYH